MRPVITKCDWSYNHAVKIIQCPLRLDIFFTESCSKLTKIEQKTCTGRSDGKTRTWVVQKGTSFCAPLKYRTPEIFDTSNFRWGSFRHSPLYFKKLFLPFSKNHNFRWSLWYSKKATLDEYTTESNCANKDYNGKGDLAIIVLDGFIDVKNGAKPFENHVKPACRNNYLPSGSLGSK